MNPKWNKYLGALLGLQLVIIVGSKLVGGNSTETVVAKSMFDGLDTKAISGIEIRDGEKKLVALTKQGDKWLLSSGGGYPTKADKVTELLGKLPSLSGGAPVAEQATYHRALEVASTGFQREVTLQLAGKSPIKFYLGSSPGIKNVHFRKDGDNNVYLVRDLTAWDASTTASDWVDTEYFKVERDSITGVHLKNANGEVQLAKAADGKWTVSGFKPDTKINQGEIDSLITTASAISLQEPVGDKIEPSMGLQPPKALLSLTTKDNKTHALQIGEKVGDAYYAKSDTSTFVVKIATYSAETFLNKKLADFEEQKKDEAKAPPQGVSQSSSQSLKHGSNHAS